MKAVKILLCLVLVSISVFADASSSHLSVDAQIAQIQSAPPQKRVELMNQFKLRLSTMNAQERSSAIAQMQRKNSSHTTHSSSNQHHAREQNMMMQRENMHNDRNYESSMMKEMNQNYDSMSYGNKQENYHNDQNYMKNRR